MTNEMKCTCKGVLGHSRQCAMFDESKMEGLHRKALAMGDDPGVLGGAAGASEGQADQKPRAWLIDPRTVLAGTTFVIQDRFEAERYAQIDSLKVTPLYTHPSAEIAALRERINAAASLNAIYADEIRDLRERIAAQDVDIAENDALIDQLRERIAGMEKAIAPFVKAFENTHLSSYARADVSMTDFLDRNTVTPSVTVGDFRRLRDAALAKEKQG